MLTRNWVLALAACATAACGGGGGGGSGGGTTPPPGGQPPPMTTVPDIALEQAFTNLTFSQPLAMLQAPNDASRWFIVERGGRVQAFADDPAAAMTDLFLDISGVVDTSGEGGLLGIAFHPNFPQTPEVFVSYTRTGANDPLVSYISRFASADGGVTLDAGTEQVLLTLDQEQSNHNGGDLHFGPDGYLYIGFGDSGGGGDPRGYGQALDVPHGAILRIDVDGGAPYAIPAGNPFAANTPCDTGNGLEPCPEIFAWGFRNPWRFSFDFVTGKLWLGDVGQNDWEEIDVVEVGQNYGWNVREGAHCYPPGSSCGTAGFTDPITEYGRNVGGSVTGGYVYRGTNVPDLVGWYVFGDFNNGRILAIPEDSAPGVVPDSLLLTGMSIAAFGQGIDGEIYVLDLGAGTIHEVTAAP